MDLDPHNSADLAAFFAKRFPHAAQRDALASEAHVRFREPPTDDPSVAWGGLLTRAQEQAALERLARCAARRMPSDENLQGVSAVLNGRAWPPAGRQSTTPTWLRQVGVMAALVVLAVGSVWMVRSEEAAELAEVRQEAPEALVAVRPVSGTTETPRLAKSVVVEPPAATTAAVDGEAPAGSDAPEGVGEDAPPTALSNAENGRSDDDSATPATPAAQLPGCRGAPGELVGYWYAGATPPGGKGDRITVPRDLNVRADYPDRHNNYDRRAPIRCTLGVGQSLVLTADPIAVPGGAYWVPLHAVGN